MVDVLLQAGDALKAQLARHQGGGGDAPDTTELLAARCARWPARAAAAARSRAPPHSPLPPQRPRRPGRRRGGACWS